MEGETEFKALPEFLRRWLNPKLTRDVRIDPVKFNGWAELVKEARRKAHLYLDHPRQKDEIIAVISLLDLYGPEFYPPGQSAAERCEWGRSHIEKQVAHPRFRHFFAVHEIEAWLLSQPGLFPREVRDAFPQKVKTPEAINFNETPYKLLSRLYSQKTPNGYKKVTDGVGLFKKLNPSAAAEKCPNLKALLEEMLKLSQEAGLG